VFNDADVGQAVEGGPNSFSKCGCLPYLGVSGAILSKFRGAGQTCICANRIYVQSDVYAEFASRLAERVATFKPGNGLEEGM
jgi:hypothetical protein